MRISVLTPTYNRRDMLKQTIESFITQTYDDKEMIVIDDGSTDGTNQLFEERGHPDVKYSRKENGGISSAYNFGLEKATGDLICIMQDDDLFFDKHSISQRAYVFQHAAECGINLEVIWTSGMDINGDGSDMKKVVAVPVNVAYAWKVDRIQTETMMWRKSIHERIGGFYGKCNEDWDFKLRCLMECSCVSVPRLITAKYRRWGGNASIDNIKMGRRDEAEHEFRERLKKRYGAMGL